MNDGPKRQRMARGRGGGAQGFELWTGRARAFWQSRRDRTPRFPRSPCPVQALPTMSSPLRIGVVGCGFIADVIAHAIAEADGAVLVAAASRRRETAEAFAGKHGAGRVFDRWEDLVASPDVDAVYVATPTVLREVVSVAAARKRKHVLADKPFQSLQSVHAITAACGLAGVAFLDATHFTHHPRTAQLKRERAERIGGARGRPIRLLLPQHGPLEHPL